VLGEGDRVAAYPPSRRSGTCRRLRLRGPTRRASNQAQIRTAALLVRHGFFSESDGSAGSFPRRRLGRVAPAGTTYHWRPSVALEQASVSIACRSLEKVEKPWSRSSKSGCLRTIVSLLMEGLWAGGAGEQAADDLAGDLGDLRAGLASAPRRRAWTSSRLLLLVLLFPSPWPPSARLALLGLGLR
jgi:hypothetical protein